MAEKPVATKELSVAQKRHLSILTERLAAAQTALDAAQQNGNNFLTYCADEHGLRLGVDGWTFNQAEMRFLQTPAPKGDEGSK